MISSNKINTLIFGLLISCSCNSQTTIQPQRHKPEISDKSEQIIEDSGLVEGGYVPSDSLEENYNPFIYPHQISQLGLQKIYDDARWRLYCLHVDQQLKFNSNSVFGTEKNVDITFGQLPLKFDYLAIDSSTIKILMQFFYKRARVSTLMVDNAPCYGIIYSNGTNDVLNYIQSTSSMEFYMPRCNPQRPKSECTFREINPLQPDVVKFIKENKDKLDTWFRKEAIKRGVIKE